jgi:H2-forming N5,N10-methylenetetrahydromethanopterin dehydrogenase-like enzyme
MELHEVKHPFAGMTAGFVATIVSNPLDVVSTRLMAAKKSELAVGKSTMETISQMWEREGLASFYKGFGPNVLRISTFNMALWTSYEQIRRLGNE